jgi:anion-transporting  ArsA/GET3 family ATPase
LNQHPAETAEIVEPSADAGTIEIALREFWEKTRSAVALVAKLRADRRSLSEKLVKIEQELIELRNDLTLKDQEVKRLRAENAQLLSSNGQDLLTEEEKENLKSRIRELIARINSHL